MLYLASVDNIIISTTHIEGIVVTAVLVLSTTVQIVSIASTVSTIVIGIATH